MKNKGEKMKYLDKMSTEISLLSLATGGNRVGKTKKRKEILNSLFFGLHIRILYRKTELIVR